jgi:hypothetical protein
MHGDIAITYGRYIAQNRIADPAKGAWFSVWFERVYAKRDGHWLYVSHRTVHGPNQHRLAGSYRTHNAPFTRIDISCRKENFKPKSINYFT